MKTYYDWFKTYHVLNVRWKIDVFWDSPRCISMDQLSTRYKYWFKMNDIFMKKNEGAYANATKGILAELETQYRDFLEIENESTTESTQEKVC